MDNHSNSQRDVIPRWRTLNQTPIDELSPVKSNPNNLLGGDKISNQLDTNFAETKKFEDAAELVEFSASISKTKQSLAAAKLLQEMQCTPILLKKLADQLVQESSKSNTARDEPEVNLTSLQQATRDSIQKLKVKLHNSPRNGLLALEISRLQFQIGQHSSAVHYAERAIKTFPNHRYIIRSFACLLSSIDEWCTDEWGADGKDRALFYIRKSDSFRWDPWVQSAEVAVSNAMKKVTKLPKSRLQQLRQLKHGNRSLTELTAGLATIETQSGNRKAAKHFLELSMVAPNENSLAQLRWLQQKKNLAPLVQPNTFVGNAFEADVYESIKLENPENAVSHAESWQIDQPYLSQPALVGSSLCLSVLNEPIRAIRSLDRALLAQPNHLSLHNNRFVALLMDGQINEAIKVFEERLRVKRVGQDEPFSFAAMGLLAFATGHYKEGRKCYGEAMQSATKLKNPELVVTAFIYWIGREHHHNQISKVEALELIGAIEKQLEKQTAVRKKTSMALNALRLRVSESPSVPVDLVVPEIRKTAEESYGWLSSAANNASI
jgi:tetratricopeptide (TPR) repeat protein